MHLIYIIYDSEKDQKYTNMLLGLCWLSFMLGQIEDI